MFATGIFFPSRLCEYSKTLVSSFCWEGKKVSLVLGLWMLRLVMGRLKNILLARAWASASGEEDRGYESIYVASLSFHIHSIDISLVTAQQGRWACKQLMIIKSFIKLVTLWSMHVQLLNCIPHFATPWTVVHQAPLSMGFPRQEHWRGLPFPTPEDLPNSGIEPASPAWQVDSLPLSHLGPGINQDPCDLILYAYCRHMA